jgi:hypothetical protein
MANFRTTAGIHSDRDTSRTDEAWKRFGEDGFILALRCQGCTKIDKEFRVAWMMIDPDAKDKFDAVVLGRVFRCKHCGAEDNYALEPSSQMTIITGAMVGMTREDEVRADSPVLFGVPRLKDGFTYHRPSEAIRHLRERTEKNPGNYEGWLRLGNFLSRHEQMEEAGAAFSKAESVGGARLDVLFNLMRHHLETDRAGEAWACMCRAVESVPESPQDVRDEVVPPLVHFLEAGMKTARRSVWLHAVWRGERAENGAPTMMMSGVDLRRLRRWDRLAEFLMEEKLSVLVLAEDGPPDHPTILEKRLEGNSVAGDPVVEVCRMDADSQLKPVGKVARNAPCPCASGLKFKRCCGK